jgi:hypothetical protein
LMTLCWLVPPFAWYCWVDSLKSQIEETSSLNSLLCCCHITVSQSRDKEGESIQSVREGGIVGIESKEKLSLLTSSSPFVLWSSSWMS